MFYLENNPKQMSALIGLKVMLQGTTRNNNFPRNVLKIHNF